MSIKKCQYFLFLMIFFYGEILALKNEVEHEKEPSTLKLHQIQYKRGYYPGEGYYAGNGFRYSEDTYHQCQAECEEET